MSSDWERGFAAGYEFARARAEAYPEGLPLNYETFLSSSSTMTARKPKRKRKLSDWQKYVKVNSKKPRFKYKSGSKKGRVNFKALGVAFRKTPAGKKKRR